MAEEGQGVRVNIFNRFLNFRRFFRQNWLHQKFFFFSSYIFYYYYLEIVIKYVYNLTNPSFGQYSRVFKLSNIPSKCCQTFQCKRVSAVFWARQFDKKHFNVVRTCQMLKISLICFHCHFSIFIEMYCFEKWRAGTAAAATVTPESQSQL